MAKRIYSPTRKARYQYKKKIGTNNLFVNLIILNTMYRDRYDESIVYTKDISLKEILVCLLNHCLLSTFRARTAIKLIGGTENEYINTDGTRNHHWKKTFQLFYKLSYSGLHA